MTSLMILSPFEEHLHQYPELSFEESKTAQYVCSVLNRFGIRYTANIGGHGIVALIPRRVTRRWRCRLYGVIWMHFLYPGGKFGILSIKE